MFETLEALVVVVSEAEVSIKEYLYLLAAAAAATEETEVRVKEVPFVCIAFSNGGVGSNKSCRIW